MTLDPEAPVSLYQQVDQACLSLHSRFTFHCHHGLACFNRCCRTPTILLSPYDILRLKNCLGISSGEFMRRYTSRETEGRSNLPLIFMDPYRSPDVGCPFLSANGCMVYPHRPAACRLFPITMGSQLTEQGMADYYFCRQLDYCQGFATDVEWTVASWRTNQGFDEYEQGRREWLEILLQQGFKGPLEVNAQMQRLFTIISYDLDKFRRMISEPAFRQSFHLDGGALKFLETNDLALLALSYRCMQSLLFTEAGGWIKEALGSSEIAEETF